MLYKNHRLKLIYAKPFQVIIKKRKKLINTTFWIIDTMTMFLYLEFMIFEAKNKDVYSGLG